jgi:hypothetical protein
MIFGHDFAFWISTIGAAIVKLFLTPFNGVLATVTSFAAAIFFAVVFTDPVLNYLNLNPDSYKIGVAAVVALTGEGIAKRILGILADQNATFSFIRLWRNKDDDRKDQ